MLNYGVIGVGPVFQNFQVEGLLQSQSVNLYTACDLKEDLLTSVQQQYDFKKCCTDYGELLQDSNIDVVLLNLPQHKHRDIAVAAAKAGKNIYVEKPFASNLKDAKAIMSACEKHGVKLCVGHQRRFITTERKAKEIIDEGYLGTVYKIRVIASWWQDISEEKRAWLTDFELGGGGPLLRWGVHKTDTMRFLLDQEAVRVFAEWDQFVFDQPHITVEDTLVALYRFEGGVIGELEVGNAQREAGFQRGETIEIWGDKGTLWYQPSTGEMELYSVEKSTNVINPDAFMRTSYEPDGKEMTRIHDRFVESIEKDTDPPITGEDGYKALEMAVGAYRSAQSKKVVHFPLDNE
ncbi:Predicted dehydrogenase [Fodinibius roseus]|uniref:Predicted dehydrogenase n=1 Tax=Fodinibius roseus TaxID=1194090 RepID=A0A1M5KZ89_9BACT|nr:Gfo/Idh/MocA family oxidoreductase [Fodinibius roseus]SHG58144.1 Predicted dehydrogenase [Fodinibius roseus]